MFARHTRSSSSYVIPIIPLPLFVRSSPGTLAVARNVFVFYVRTRVLCACEIRLVRFSLLYRPLFGIFLFHVFQHPKPSIIYVGEPSTENRRTSAHDQQPAGKTNRISIRFKSEPTVSLVMAAARWPFAKWKFFHSLRSCWSNKRSGHDGRTKRIEMVRTAYANDSTNIPRICRVKTNNSVLTALLGTHLRLWWFFILKIASLLDLCSTTTGSRTRVWEMSGTLKCL